MVRCNSKILILLGVTVLLLLAGAAQAEPPMLQIPRVTRTPKLEEILVGPSSNNEVSIKDFRQREPGDGVPVSESTVAYLSYDEKNLYIVFVCTDVRDQVRAQMAKREDILNDDQVSVYLDTFHDRQRAYVFSVNPHGIQLDGIMTEGQTTDYSFDTLWYSEGRLTEKGYAVSISIPFKSLRFSGDPTQTWGIALGRSISRKSELSYWPHISTHVDGFVPQLATLSGIQDISPGRNLQVIPYGIATRARFIDDGPSGQPQFKTVNDGRVGVDAKIVLRDALTLDITANPDFSQVESDEPQVTVNQRFEVFFPEKRPFFLENAGFFRTPVNLFFSRRIADPELGARLTGKIGRWALGALAIDDRAPGKSVAEDSPLFGDHAQIGAARVQREFGEQSSIGVLATSRSFGSSFNRIAAVDLRWRLNQNWLVNGQAIASQTRRLDGQTLDGPGYLAQIQHIGRHLRYLARYTDFSPEFTAQIGFIQRVNTRRIENSVAYSWRPKNSKIISFGPTALVFMQRDYKNKLQDWFTNLGVNVQLPKQTGLSTTAFNAVEVFGGVPFHKNGWNAILSTQWTRWMGLDAFVARRKAINYFPGPGIDPFLANAMDGEIDLVIRPSSRFRYTQTYIYTKLGMREGAPTGLPESAAIFINHIFRSKVNYQFTRELSVRAIIDYDAVLANPKLVDLDRTKRLGADLLLTYFINPGTALYVGYSDAYENYRLDPTNPTGVRFINSPTTPTGRQVFVKLSYLFRF